TAPEAISGATASWAMPSRAAAPPGPFPPPPEPPPPVSGIGLRSPVRPGPDASGPIVPMPSGDGGLVVGDSGAGAGEGAEPMPAARAPPASRFPEAIGPEPAPAEATIAGLGR